MLMRDLGSFSQETHFVASIWFGKDVLISAKNGIEGLLMIMVYNYYQLRLPIISRGHTNHASDRFQALVLLLESRKG